MKKEFEHKPKSSPRRKAGSGSAAAEGMGLTRITSPLGLSMNVLLSHRDLLKDFYLNSTHSVPSALQLLVFLFIPPPPLPLLIAGWCILLRGDGCSSTPAVSFKTFNCLMWCKGLRSVPVSSTPCKQAVFNVPGKKCLLLFRSFTGSVPLFSPHLFIFP